MRTRELKALRSLGRATLDDLARLGITTVEALATRDPRQLYDELCRRSGVRHDPCCEDVFACVIAQAKDPALPPEQRDWWFWSRERKAQGR